VSGTRFIQRSREEITNLARAALDGEKCNGISRRLECDMMSRGKMSQGGCDILPHSQRIATWIYCEARIFRVWVSGYFFNFFRGMQMEFKSKLRKSLELGVSVTAIALLLLGCSKKSDTSSTTTVTPSVATASITGVVVDGYLKDATVCLDTNSNGACDTGEPSAVTAATGAYTISGVTAGEESKYPLVAEVPSTSVDQDTGAAVGTAFTLTTPASTVVVSPLTTLVQEKIAAGESSASAVASVIQSLGISSASGVDPMKDYVALKGGAVDQNDGYYRAHEAAKTIAAVLKQGKSNLGETSAKTDKATQSTLLGQAEAVLQLQATSNVATAGSLFSHKLVTANSLPSSGTLKSLIASGNASTLAASATQAVTVNFDVYNGSAAVGTNGCAPSALTLGTAGTVGSLKDLRFYVSNVALIDASGKYSPVILDENANQAKNVALLDFEDGQNACSKGTTGTYTAITGKVAPGTYTGVVFTVGVPPKLNHTDAAATTTPAPLQNSAMAWMWQSGRKFTKIEFDKPATAVVTGSITGNKLDVTAVTSGSLAVGDTLAGTGLVVGMMGTAPKVTALGAGTGGVGTYTLSNTYTTAVAATTIKANAAVTMVHLGSTGCKADTAKGDVFNGCGSPNRMTVKFASFNACSQKIALDLAALFGGLNLDKSKTWMSGKPGGMSMGGDPTYYFDKFQIDPVTGFPINDGAAQTLFVVK